MIKFDNEENNGDENDDDDDDESEQGKGNKIQNGNPKFSNR